MSDVGIKRCTGICGRELEVNVDNFFRSKRSVDGFANQCKNCHGLGRGKPEYIIEENGSFYQICTGECNLKLEINSDNFGWEEKNKQKYCRKCKICVKKYKAKNYQENKDHVLNRVKNYREEHKEEISLQKKEFREENKEKLSIIAKQNYEENKDEINAKNREKYKNDPEYREEVLLQQKEYRKKPENKEKRNKSERKRSKERRETDPVYRLRINVSGSISRELKKNGSSKKGKSCFKYLDYSLKELRKHIEKQFSEEGNEWMTWDNWGLYNIKTWNDEDKSTWVWNLDHIDPQSDFEYISMDSNEFRECWKLSNLRPYSAKQNIIDGANRSRHKKKL
jgi:hypothetical protein